MLSGLVNGLDSLFIWLNSGLKQNLSDYVDLETGQDEFTLAAKDGSLLSILRIDGYKSLINVPSYYEKISTPLSSGFDPFLSKPGHMVQVVFSVDPTKSERVVREALNPSYVTIKKLGLELEGILDERVKNISRLANYEQCFVVLWTRPSALVKSDAKQERTRKNKMRMNQRTPTKFAQDPFAGNSLLHNQHSSFVNNINELFYSVGVASEKLKAHEAVRVVRQSIDDEYTSDKWSPFLPGDSIMPNVRHEMHKAKEWDVVWPDRKSVV